MLHYILLGTSLPEGKIVLVFSIPPPPSFFGKPASTYLLIIIVQLQILECMNLMNGIKYMTGHSSVYYMYRKMIIQTIFEYLGKFINNSKFL